MIRELVDETNVSLHYQRLNLFPKSLKQIEQYAEHIKTLSTEAFEQIITNIEAKNRTFDNTVRAMDQVQSKFNKIANSIHVLGYVFPSKELKDKCTEVNKELDKFSVDLFMNKKIYNVFNEYFENQFNHEKTSNLLNQELLYYLEEKRKEFKRNGYTLSDELFDVIKNIKKDISDLCIEYSNNINDDNSHIKVTKEELQGLSEEFIKGLKTEENTGLYILGVDYPTYFQTIQNCQIEETRKKLNFAFQNRAYPKNMDVLSKLINKRDELAKKLGFQSYAELDIDDSMAQKPEIAETFYRKLFEKAGVKMKQELALLCTDLPASVQLKNGKFQAWDYPYAKYQYKKKHYQIDENEIAEYFPEEQTTQKMLDIYQNFFNLKFLVQKPEWQWHEDVKVIKVYDGKDSKYLGELYLDLYPRANKYSHACVAYIINASRQKNIQTKQYTFNPYMGVMIANFPKSSSEKPALFKHDDVETFFHEFGHAVHGLLSNVEIDSIAGTKVKRDFIEMPSQMLENWMIDKNILQQVSCHYKTNTPLPSILIDKKIQLKQFDSGFVVQKQGFYSFVALKLYEKGENKDTDGLIQKIHEEFIEEIVFEQNTHFQSAFGHLTSYGASYYGYMWSDVFAKDVFYEVKKHGLLNSVIGQKLRDCIFSKGGSQDPNLMLTNFLDREPNQDAFFNDYGFNKI